MNAEDLFDQIRKKQSFLCVGLDADEDKIPSHLFKYDDPVFEFNKAIIDATHDLVVAYKPNLAFYEAMGTKGIISLEKTNAYIQENFPEIIMIADAKRGDIGNTARMYARSVFEQFGFDAVTLSPYMGKDSIDPFFEYKDKWVVLLGVTSNSGAEDFQLANTDTGRPFFMEVIDKGSKWADENQLMFVAGATRPEMLKEIRQVIPNHFLLVPGVGAQGGNLEDVAANGINSQCGLLVNSSRAIIYAGNNEHFAQEARISAHDLQDKMKAILFEHNLLD
ncbi:MAG TPA: orotidine-5'-phosphate decarboxylase [Salinivirga sp.]|uniref:orotidine-5'-phosphate decarboxylase n=1 Tax=Salinivirga sp. TaxID=1970192 RepID=UPI002B46C826|nr:orotidine-5'-phosphate decarboxylase [Salinivirga sp.]HKK58886.1 orotidine-5'-phosphate decarboxylase [Salinivirga sp.]